VRCTQSGVIVIKRTDVADSQTEALLHILHAHTASSCGGHRPEAVAADGSAVKGGLSVAVFAKDMGLAMTVARDLLLEQEQKGVLCRDQSIEGLRFFPNLFAQPPRGAVEVSG